MSMKVSTVRGTVVGSGGTHRFHVIAITAMLLLLVPIAIANEPPNVDELGRAGPDTFVGAVTDDLFIGVTTAPHPDEPERHALMAYLCDGD